jgi:hypothetical protein
VVRRGKFLSPQAKRFIDMLDPEFSQLRYAPVNREQR